MRGRRREQAVGDLVSAALKDLGVPPVRVSAPLVAAFERALDPAWRGQVRLERLQAGVLDVSVASAALKEELTQFHGVRLLAVLRAEVPAVPLTRLRFLASGTQALAGPPATGPAATPGPTDRTGTSGNAAMKGKA